MARNNKLDDVTPCLQVRLDPNGGFAPVDNSIVATVTVTDGLNQPLDDVHITMELVDSAGVPSEYATFSATGAAQVSSSTDASGTIQQAFTDYVAETAYLRAFVTSDQSNSVSHSFTFTPAHKYQVDLTIDTDGMPADGLSANVVYAVVSDKGRPVPVGTPVTFLLPDAEFGTFLDGTKLMTVLTKKDPQDGLSKAWASIVDSYPVGESVTVNAKSVGKDAFVILSFAKVNVHTYDLQLSKEIDGQPSDGVSRDVAKLTASFEGKNLPAGTKALFNLPENMYATFLDGTKRKEVVLVPNDEKLASVATIEVVDVYALGEKDITLNVQCGGQETTTEFFFTPAPTYDYDVQLNVVLNGQPADGIASNELEAVVSYKGAAPSQSTTITFTLPPTLFAEFSNGQKAISPKLTPDPDGKQSRVKVNFVDHNPQGENPVVVNARCGGTEKTASFYFAAVPVVSYVLRLLPGLDGQPADGISKNSAILSVTYGGKPAAQSTPVVFTLPQSGFATFDDNTKQKVVLLDGRGIATVEFADINPLGEAKVALNALCGGVNASCFFSFAKAGRETPAIELTRLNDGAPADGASENGVAISVKVAGHPVFKASVLLILPGDKWAAFANGEKSIQVQTKEDGTASATFSDSYLPGETVTLQACYGGESAYKDFHFSQASALVYKLALIPQTNNSASDGKSQNSATAKLTYKGKPFSTPTPVTFVLPDTSSASFEDGTKKTQVTTATNGTAEISFVDNNPQGESVDLAALACGQSAYSRFQFSNNAPGLYIFYINGPDATNQKILYRRYNEKFQKWEGEFDTGCRCDGRSFTVQFVNNAVYIMHAIGTDLFISVSDNGIAWTTQAWPRFLKGQDLSKSSPQFNSAPPPRPGSALSPSNCIQVILPYRDTANLQFPYENQSTLPTMLLPTDAAARSSSLAIDYSSGNAYIGLSYPWGEPNPYFGVQKYDINMELLETADKELPLRAIRSALLKLLRLPSGSLLAVYTSANNDKINYNFIKDPAADLTIGDTQTLARGTNGIYGIGASVDGETVRLFATESFGNNLLGITCAVSAEGVLEEVGRVTYDFIADPYSVCLLRAWSVTGG
ncbi:MAG: hypothetical protein ACN6O8_03760 [Achromobacter sp.]|uniref:hypothetical protein n=1 Tax=Achromobacter sp. TaxID=134375 RepID=UPI003CFDD159